MTTFVICFPAQPSADSLLGSPNRLRDWKSSFRWRPTQLS